MFGNKELSSKHSVSWSQRPRIVEKVLKVAPGKEAGGWWKAGRRGVPGSVASTLEPGEIQGTGEGVAKVFLKVALL